MPKNNPIDSPYREFMGKYTRDIVENTAAEQRSRTGSSLAVSLAEIEPVRMIFSPADFWKEVRRWWPVRILRRAAKENAIEGYKRVLHYWLSCLNDEPPPKGVLQPWKGKPGRPREKESDVVVLTWIKIGRPALGRQKLARKYYGDAFTNADAAEKKKMVDRCQKAVERRVPSTEIPKKRRNPSPN
jgi:hypothetical protein